MAMREDTLALLREATDGYPMKFTYGVKVHRVTVRAKIIVVSTLDPPTPNVEIERRYRHIIADGMNRVTIMPDKRARVSRSDHYVIRGPDQTPANRFHLWLVLGAKPPGVTYRRPPCGSDEAKPQGEAAAPPNDATLDARAELPVFEAESAPATPIAAEPQACNTQCGVRFIVFTF